jgi:PD-(D/E)XK nuclease superfamily
MTITFKDPWGFSKLDSYRDCPAKFKYQFIDKLSQPSSPAMERGGKMHEVIENYLNGWIPDLPANLGNWQEPLDALKKEDFKAEQALGIDNAWKLLPNWFHSTTWLRSKADAMYTKCDQLVVIDFKSGKYRIPSTEQIELYAIVGLSVYPDIEKIKAEFWFLDTGEVYSRDYTRAELVGLRSKYEGYAAKLYTETNWKPAPSVNCRWCAYSKTKGGPCAF